MVTETYIVVSKLNKDIKFLLPWSNSHMATLAVGLKEIIFDNFIPNVEEDIIITISEIKKNTKENVIINIFIPKGSYEIEEILDLINLNLDNAKIKDIKFGFNKHDGKFYLENKSKFTVTFNKIGKYFFKLQHQVQPSEIVKSFEKFEILKSRSLYVRVKGLRNGIYSNITTMQSRQSEIIHVSTVTNNYGQTKVEHITNDPIFYYFHNFKLNEVEIIITDEFGNEVDIQNIRLILYFKTEERKGQCLKM